MNHEVFNQPPLREDINLFTSDPALAEAFEVFGSGRGTQELESIGAFAGSSEAEKLSVQAERNSPRLQTHDRFGNRVDLVEYDASYHRFMHESVTRGLHATAWADETKGAHVERAAKFFVMSQAEGGHLCPISMTYSAIAALRSDPQLQQVWEPALVSRTYDPSQAPAAEKAGTLAGMAMTEKQGGSDVRANTTRAERLSDGTYLLKGHKWFCSAPMCDVFLMLAQTDAGVTCFVVPRRRDDGSLNGIRIQRLKDKLGNRSNASSEIELDGTIGHLLGEEGRGVTTIIEMVNRTRLDCVLGSAAGMRAGCTNAVWHTRHRATFGSVLIDQPLMRSVLADLYLESEAAMWTAISLAALWEDPSKAVLARLVGAVSKFFICKRAPIHAAEALECLGGNGFVEDSPMPRIYRDSPLNSIWEGSANVICLDVLRTIARQPESLEALREFARDSADAEPRIAALLKQCSEALADTEHAEARARSIASGLALVVQAALLVRHAPSFVSDAFCASRLEGEGLTFGTLDASYVTTDLLDRAVGE